MLLDRLRAHPAAYAAHTALLALAPEAVLVGGAVRDLLLDQPLHDLDYVLPGNALPVARRLADALNAAYFPLDETRGVGRVLIRRPGAATLEVDLSSLGGNTLEQDIRARDFSVNAIALLPNGKPYDLFDGIGDLEKRLLRPCTPASLRNDPVRVLRAVRFLYKFQLHPAPGLDDFVREAAPGLGEISAERQRDELLKILALPEPHFAFMQLDSWGLEPRLFSALVNLHGVGQSPPHVYDVYEHTLAVLRGMARIDQLLRRRIDSASEIDAALLSVLGPHLPDLRRYLARAAVPDRPRWLWLRAAALMHDWGKPAARSLDDDGRIRYFGHEDISARMAVDWLGRFKCAGDEIKLVSDICAAHMRPFGLHQGPQPPGRRALYRFYRDLDHAAVGVILLHIADYLGTYGPGLDPAQFRQHLDFVLILLRPAFEFETAPILPKPLLNGHDLISIFGLTPGPELGQLLEALREAQAVGEISDRAGAQNFVRAQLKG